MARSDVRDQQALLPFGKAVFVQKVAFTGTGAATSIASTDVDGNAIQPGSTFLVYADQDFYYQFTSGATSVTVLSGSRPGKFVLATVPDIQTAAEADTKIDIIRSSTSGTLALYVMR